LISTPIARALAFFLSQTQQEGRKPMSHGCKGEFLDDSNQAPETRSHYPQDLECNLGMRQAEGLKVLFADEQQSRIVNRRDRRRIVPAIEHGELGDGTARSINAEHLFAAVGGAFEDADMASLNHIESGAGLAFTENDFTRRVAARNRTLR
jgi:hypothetical protein